MMGNRACVGCAEPALHRSRHLGGMLLIRNHVGGPVNMVLGAGKVFIADEVIR
jgi:hypothetical protein